MTSTSARRSAGRLDKGAVAKPGELAIAPEAPVEAEVLIEFEVPG